ncbi:hypothetical protein [Dongia sp.]|uniref:hypothetical protein n=1 Tax=Dongia sp. TaxID=1977262 RepID=UPI0035AF42ED
MALDYDRLVAKSYQDVFGDESVKVIDASVLGCMIASAWMADVSDHKFPSERLAALVTSVKDVPESVRNSLHIQERLEGDYLEETTEMVVAAQSAGLVGRLNPTSVSAIFKVNPVKASQLLKSYELDYPEEVAWVKRAIAGFRDKESSSSSVAEVA